MQALQTPTSTAGLVTYERRRAARSSMASIYRGRQEMEANKEISKVVEKSTWYWDREPDNDEPLRRMAEETNTVQVSKTNQVLSCLPPVPQVASC